MRGANRAVTGRPHLWADCENAQVRRYDREETTRSGPALAGQPAPLANTPDRPNRREVTVVHHRTPTAPAQTPARPRPSPRSALTLGEVDG
jgi:hypothetical protein